MVKLKILALTLLGLLILAMLIFMIWAKSPLGPMPEALAAMESDQYVTVSAGPWYSFTPNNEEPTSGFIFYPGGRVDPRSYAPLMREIAIHGTQAIIVPMPLNLAVLAPGKAAEVMQAYPEITKWTIGGHSLGGSMAANFAADHPGQVDGLVLLASYPASSDNLTETSIETESIFGSLDGVASLEKVKAAQEQLPENTNWVEIEGGNHAQFGWYGPQPGDNPASISREEQQNQALKAILELLFRIEGDQSVPAIEDNALTLPLFDFVLAQK
jgi:hypothetical protein